MHNGLIPLSGCLRTPSLPKEGRGGVRHLVAARHHSTTPTWHNEAPVVTVNHRQRHRRSDNGQRPAGGSASRRTGSDSPPDHEGGPLCLGPGRPVLVVRGQRLGQRSVLGVGLVVPFEAGLNSPVGNTEPCGHPVHGNPGSASSDQPFGHRGGGVRSGVLRGLVGLPKLAETLLDVCVIWLFGGHAAAGFGCPTDGTQLGQSQFLTIQL